MVGKETPVSVKAMAAAFALGSDRDRRSINVSAFCVGNEVSRAVFYKWVDRVRREGLDGLEERSRRPGTSPQQTSGEVEEEIVRLRKELADAGLDHGAFTIRWHLERGSDCGGGVPSERTIHRILVRRGLVTPQPQKRPKSSFQRFVASAPNEMWQIDHTDWGSPWRLVKIFNILDDHSRVLIRSRAVFEATTHEAWTTFSQGAEMWGLPAGALSDNGLCFSGKLRRVEVFFESRLRDAGVKPITGRPYHPQTTGKVERFQSTLKKWLEQQPVAGSIGEIQEQLDQFTHLYNFERPHQGIDRMVPADRWHATPASGPASEPLAHPEWPSRSMTAIVAGNGCVAVDDYIIHLGVEHQDRNAHILIDDKHANVFIDNQLVRHVKLDPTRRYQPSGRRRGGPPRPRIAS
jgi:transposase InsO family protein